jgi:phosphoribosylformylglycinamidine synthase
VRENKGFSRNELVEFLNQNKVAMLKYCDSKGDVINDFPINPNGSMFNLAAIGNIRGNIMAIMPHPERTSQCDCIFNSMKKYIADTLHMAKNFERSEAIQKGSSKEIQSGFPNTTVKIKPNQIELIIESIITDNTAMSAELALQKLGYPVSLKRQIHWIIEHDGTNKNLLNDIIQSEELFNPRKEYVVDLLTRNSDAFVKSILVQEKQDSTGKNKLHNLKNIHNIFGIKNISYGVLWNISMNLENTDFENIINSNLFFNQYAHDVYFL